MLPRCLTIFALLIGALTACHDKSTDAVDPSSVRAPMEWATSFLGAPPQGRLVLRQPLGAGYLVKDLLNEHIFDAGPLRWAAAHCAQTDVYVSGDENIVVMHGVPGGLDPMKAAPGDEPHAPEFRLLGTAPSGALGYERSYSSASGTSQRSKRKLFVLPSGTWITGQSFTGERLSIALAAKAEEPPLLPLLPNAIVQLSVDVTPGTIHEAASRVRGSHVIRWIQGLDRVRALAFAIYPSTVRERTPASLVLLYDGSGAAHDAAEDASRLIRSGALERQLKSDEIIGADSQGALLFVRLLLKS